jgi:hypothetical protein
MINSHIIIFSRRWPQLQPPSAATPPAAPPAFAFTFFAFEAVLSALFSFASADTPAINNDYCHYEDISPHWLIH